jgi:hypothetical protein
MRSTTQTPGRQGEARDSAHWKVKKSGPVRNFIEIEAWESFLLQAQPRQGLFGSRVFGVSLEWGAARSHCLAID